jgi:hypothetical protein
MVSNAYKLKSSKNQTKFGFISSGPKGVFQKVVMFDRLSNGKWNLAFGDFKNGYVDDEVVTNNNDITKVLGTVAKAVYIFSERYPNRKIIIQPVDERRKRLYNTIFNRHFDTISLTFDIFGKIKGRWQPFVKEIPYDSFELVRK